MEREAVRQRSRLLLVVLVTAVTFAALGLGAGRLIQSPDDAARAAKPPSPSVITARIERKALSSAVVVRGDIAATDVVEVKADGVGADATDGATVVTGRLPKEGARLPAGSVAVEISGRPVFLLEGTHPVYRALRPGTEGPDVRQLERNLVSLGFNPGKIDETYDAGTEKAVAALYSHSGYDAPGPTEPEKAQLMEASRLVKQRRSALRTAEQKLQSADKKTKALRQAVADAKDDLAEAKKAFAELDGTIGTWVPRAELTFVRNLPMTVARVKTKIGQNPSGTLLTLAGGADRISVDLAPKYRKLIKVGGKAEVDDAATGLTATGTITFIADEPGVAGAAPGLIRVRIKPDSDLKAAGRELNVRVRIPISATEGEVLVVPEAALFARSDGSVRLRVLRDGEYKDVEVRTGLAADGLVEVDGAVDVGDEVVVGDR